jgi:hypothetical protein
MIVQDSQTGAYHEVPDHLYGYGDYGDQLVYDGLGNPVGRLSGPFDFIGNALKSVVGAIPGVGPVLSNLLPGGAAAPPIPPTVPLPMPFPQLPIPGLATAPGFPSMRPPWPTGWVRPPLPYTGLGPRRLYMRCAVWPGPRGLVPGYAQNLPPQPPPGVPPQALPYMGGGRHHHRRHRR